MMSRASLVRCSCPWRVKLIFPQTHLPCLTSSWVTMLEAWAAAPPSQGTSGPRGAVQTRQRDRHELSGEARPQCQSLRPQCQSLRPQCQSLFGNPRWISLISSCSHEIDSTAGRAVKGSLRRPKLHGERRVNGSRRSSRCLSPRPQLRDFTKAIILPNPQALPNPSVLAVKGSRRRFAPWTAAGRSEGEAVYEEKGRYQPVILYITQSHLISFDSHG